MNPIRTDASNTFAHESFTHRLPAIIRDIQGTNNYSLEINAALDDLHEQVLSDAPLPPPPLTAPDAQTWLDAYEQHKGETWQNAEWLFAETYFFHLINEIVGYWRTGIDHFKWQKLQEIRSEAFGDKLEALATKDSNPPDDLAELIALSLWGNRADLSLPEVLASQGQTVSPEDLLLDNRPQALETLANATKTVHLITDNFGTELAMDLLLVDALLQRSIPVMLHLKMHPTYVSDASPKDLIWLLEIINWYGLSQHARIQEAFNEGRLRVAPHFFWNSPHFLNKLPNHLMQLFSDASLIILKGDANYRRAFFDTIWPVDKPATEIVNYLPAPMLCLRTLKSDCLAGVPQELAAKAETANPNWRVLGKYGLIQYIEQVNVNL